MRRWWLDPDPDAPVTEAVLEAGAIVFDFRASFQRPLDKVTIQLRRFVRREVEEVIVAQRLKRLPTIIDKLGRQPSMDITRMQDIGGCRAVLPSAREVEQVASRITQHWRIDRAYDYVTDPKPSGYRATHLVVIRDGRLIEIQLRTPGQQQWAEAVERAGSRLRVSVKDGQGPPEILRFFELLGSVIALEEAGEAADDAVVRELESLSKQVRPLMARNG